MGAPPRVFVAYSTEELVQREVQKHWVRDLAKRLRGDGVDVWLDLWELAPGDQIAHYLENARQADFVLVVCTPRYGKEANERRGSVGYESDVLTGERLSGRNPRKFVPVLRAGSWVDAAPTWLLGSAYIDLSGDPYSEAAYTDLLNTLLGVRELAPPVGQPRWPPQPVTHGLAAVKRHPLRLWLVAIGTVSVVLGADALTARRPGTGTPPGSSGTGQAVPPASPTPSDSPPAAAPPPPPDLCEEYATVRRIDSLAPVILRKSGQSANRVYTDILHCAYYPSEGIARLKISLGWNGIFTNRPYELTGDLVLKGDEWAFMPGAGNGYFTQLERNQRLLLGLAQGLSEGAESTPTSRPSRPAPDTRSRTTAVCLSNDVQQKVYFTWRRTVAGDGWQEDSLLAGQTYRFSSTAPDTLRVSLDVSLAETDDNLEYTLPMTSVTPAECDRRSGYYMTAVADTIRIYSR